MKTAKTKMPAVAPSALVKASGHIKGVRASKGPPHASVTSLRGFVCLHYHYDAPYGEIAGGEIVTTQKDAVELAVRTVIVPNLEDVKNKETQSVLRGRIKAGDFAEALAVWSDYMQNVQGLTKKTREQYPEQIEIRDFPIRIGNQE